MMDARKLCLRLKEVSNALRCDSSHPHPPHCHMLVLVLSGALNPVHNAHVGMLHAAGRAVEKQTNGAAVYVGGILAPSSHSYVKGKLKEEALQLESRNAMSELAVADDPHIVVAPFGVASGNGVCNMVMQHLMDHCLLPPDGEDGPSSASNNNKQIPPHHRQDAQEGGEQEGGVSSSSSSSSWKLPSNFPFADLRVVPVYGSDFYTKYRTISSKPRVIVTRHDNDGSASAAKELYLSQKAEGSVHPDFIFLELEEHIPDYSSTAIRHALRVLEHGGVSDDKREEAKAYLHHAFHPLVYRYMLDTPRDRLYCGAQGRPKQDHQGERKGKQQPQKQP